MTATLDVPAAPPRALRGYQEECLGNVYHELHEGNTPTAAVMATGLGKTDVLAAAATRAARAGRRVLILAHREELLDQITERCLMHAPEVPVGRVQGSKGKAQTRRPITVAMVQSMGKARRARMLRPDLVIVDECHHASSPSYMAVLQWAGCIPPEGESWKTWEPPAEERTPMVGVTATLTRGDKRGLGMVFRPASDGAAAAFERGTVWAIEHGWLVRPRGRVVVTSHMDLNKAKTRGGDYVDGELGEMVAQDVDQIVKAWQEHAADRITVAFTPSVDSARQLADEFRTAGVPTGEVYGSTPSGERQDIYARLGRGELRVLVSVMVTTEGWDCPPVSCVLMARPTKLRGLYTQIVGRGLRLSPGKDDCLVLDVVGASRFQRLVTLAELLPGAEYDQEELDLVPCSECAGYIGRKPQVVAAALARGMVSCSCPCPGECGETVNECVCEGDGAQRDPDGGRKRLQGPAQYSDIDLVGGLAESELNWLATRGGISFVSAGKFLAAVIPDGEGTFSAGYCKAFGRTPGVDLVERVSIEQARAAVEEWAFAQEHCYPRAAAWRQARKSPSEASIRVASQLGIPTPERYTAGGLADVIDIERASRRFDG